MTALEVLFIGGSGQISSACAQRAVDLGMELHVLNRGRTSARPLPAGAHRLDNDRSTGPHTAPFPGRPGHFVFTSSASPYKKPGGPLPIVESTPLRNPIWPYSQD